MNKKIWTSKIVFVVFIILIILNINLNSTQAVSGVISGAQKFEDAHTSLGSDSVTKQMAIDENTLKEASDLVYNALLFIGIVVAVIVGLILGIKYMAGSIDQKAEIKQTLIPYVTGCIIIFGAFGIWKLVVTLLNQM